jgi:hypothetical protein
MKGRFIVQVPCGTFEEQGGKGDSGIPPWVAAPHCLINWWNMEKFSAEMFFRIGEVMEKLQASWGKPDTDFSSHLQTKVYDVALLEIFVQQCDLVGVNVAARLMERLKNDLSIDKPTIEPMEVSNRLRYIFDTIIVEMSNNVFMYIPKERSTRYGLEEPFGSKVAKSFPSISFDAKEAGNCFASSRFTACVFHLMRVLEIGLAAFAEIFSVPYDHTNWHTIIEGIERKVRDMGKDPNKLPDWKDKQEKYAQAANSFMFFKDAWRNYTAHYRSKYTEDEADGIYRNVCSFMKQLAEQGICELIHE